MPLRAQHDLLAFGEKETAARSSKLNNWGNSFLVGGCSFEYLCLHTAATSPVHGKTHIHASTRTFLARSCLSTAWLYVSRERLVFL